MAALRHMTDNDLKELGVPMVSISPTICTKGISVDRAGFLGQMPPYVVMFCFLSSIFFCKVLIRLQEQYLYSFCLSLLATSFSCWSVSFSVVPLSEYI